MKYGNKPKAKLTEKLVREFMLNSGFSARPQMKVFTNRDGLKLYKVEWAKKAAPGIRGYVVGGHSTVPDRAVTMAYETAREYLEKGPVTGFKTYRADSLIEGTDNGDPDDK